MTIMHLARQAAGMCAAVLALASAAAAAEIEQGRFELSDGTGLNYLEAGEGPVLLLVPGWSQTAAMFAPQLEGLSDAFRVIAVDMRGHGDSDKPDHGYRISRLAADLHELMQGLELEEVALGGHSMGSSVIWSYWEQFDDDMLGSILIIDQAPACVAMPGWSEDEAAEAGTVFAPQALWDMAAALAGPEGTEATEGMVRGAFFTPAYAEAHAEEVLAENLKMPRPYAARLLIDHCSKDWRDVIPRIDVPAIVFGGEASLFTPASQRWIAEAIPGAEAHIFGADEGGSHFMFLENPEKFNELVRAFLQR